MDHRSQNSRSWSQRHGFIGAETEELWVGLISNMEPRWANVEHVRGLDVRPRARKKQKHERVRATLSAVNDSEQQCGDKLQTLHRYVFLNAEIHLLA